MIKKIDIVDQILAKCKAATTRVFDAKQYAPSNMALCKYWGKRNSELNLPETSSLSVSLNGKGTTTRLALIDQNEDEITLDNVLLQPTDNDYKRIANFLDLFRTTDNHHFRMISESNIPTASGLASSASGFAALILALNQLYDWRLSLKDLSILARLGSGSACRSIYQGFVEWHAGTRQDGMDSFSTSLNSHWSTLNLGILTISDKRKAISSRVAMQQTIETSPLYRSWPSLVDHDLRALKKSIDSQDFQSLGKVTEGNALAMHAMMLAARPAICYFLPETVAIMQKIWKLRSEGLRLYFTEDAGPNLVLLFLNEDDETVRTHFPTVQIIKPFN